MTPPTQVHDSATLAATRAVTETLGAAAAVAQLLTRQFVIAEAAPDLVDFGEPPRAELAPLVAAADGLMDEIIGFLEVSAPRLVPVVLQHAQVGRMQTHQLREEAHRAVAEMAVRAG